MFRNLGPALPLRKKTGKNMGVFIFAPALSLRTQQCLAPCTSSQRRRGNGGSKRNAVWTAKHATTLVQVFVINVKANVYGTWPLLLTSASILQRSGNTGEEGRPRDTLQVRWSACAATETWLVQAPPHVEAHANPLSMLQPPT